MPLHPFVDAMKDAVDPKDAGPVRETEAMVRDFPTVAVMACHHRLRLTDVTTYKTAHTWLMNTPN
jgi:hypothetical protein